MVKEPGRERLPGENDRQTDRLTDPRARKELESESRD